MFLPSAQDGRNWSLYTRPLNHRMNVLEKRKYLLLHLLENEIRLSERSVLVLVKTQKTIEDDIIQSNCVSFLFLHALAYKHPRSTVCH